MTSRVYPWPWVYEVSVSEVCLFWQSQKNEFPHLCNKYEFFIDLGPILAEIWPILSQKMQQKGRRPKSRISQFFFALFALFF